DGLVDEEYAPEATSCGVAACGATGATSCEAGVEVDSCDPGTPALTDATCDGVDDDCDGSVDEDFAIEACATGQLGVCGTGVTSCEAGASVCVADTPAPDDAVGNVLDDDCDGLVDEEYAPEATSCGVGACGATGATSCVAGAVLDSCDPGTPASTDAICDGVDDDCDGSTDEDYWAPYTGCGVGACGAGGRLECVEGALVNTCVPGTPAPSDQVCNGVDDDCDGSVDEEYAPEATSCGVGACGSTGATSCVTGVVVDSCDPGIPGEADETCNGVDEDCDGSTDEDYASLRCATGDVGICFAGATRCEDGMAVCVADWLPQAEICEDGLDNDCDGATDLADECVPINCSGLPDGTQCSDGDPEAMGLCDAGACSVTPVPEPGSASQWLAVVLLAAWARRRRRQ
ncbi:MAG: MopE-related protein, partial [Myxococcota bacterium]